MVKHLPTMWETWVQSLGREDLLEKAMAPHSSTLAWKIPWTEEPSRLQSMGSQRVGHNWATSLSLSSLLMKTFLLNLFENTNWNYIFFPSFILQLLFSLQMVVLFVNFFFPVVGVPSGWQSLSDCQRTRWITLMAWLSFPLCFRSVCSTAVSLNERATSAPRGSGQGWCLTLGFFLSVLFSPPLPPCTLTRLFAFCSFTR